MRHRRLPRPFHIAFCVLGLLAVLTVLRLMYGPPSVYGEKAILRRMERQNLRTHGELIGYWSDMSEQTFAFWDGAEILIYQTNWENKGYFAGEDRTPVPKPLIHRYRYGHLLWDSRHYGWGTPGPVIEVQSPYGSEWMRKLPVLVKNSDPAVKSGELTVTARDYSENNNGYVHKYTWQTDAERENDWVFVFLMPRLNKDVNPHLLSAISGGYRAVGRYEASAEIVWYDESGKELYRQQFDLFKGDGQGEGSEYYGA